MLQKHCCLCMFLFTIPKLYNANFFMVEVAEILSFKGIVQPQKRGAKVGTNGFVNNQSVSKKHQRLCRKQCLSIDSAVDVDPLLS